MNQKKTSNPKLPSHFINTDFHIIFTSVWCSTVSTVTWIQAGRSGVQILRAARELALLQKNQTSSNARPASKSMKTKAFFLAVKWQGEDSLTTHIPLGPSLKISGAIPLLNLSASMAHIGTTLFHITPTYIHISQDVTSFLVL